MKTKKSLEIVARDYNSPFFRNYIWVSGMLRQSKILKIPQLIIGMVSEKNNVLYCHESKTWVLCHEALKKKVAKDIHFVEKLIDRINISGEEFNVWSEKNIYLANLKNTSSKILVALLKEFIEKQGELYALGVALPILDFQSFSFVEGNLTRFLKEEVAAKDFQKYYQVFTEPAHISFAQDSDENLLKICAPFFANKKWRADVLRKNLEEIKKLYPAFYRKLAHHTQKYAWVYYVYAGPAYTEKEFLEDIKNYLVKGIDPTKKLREFSEKKKRNIALKKKYIKELKPDSFNLMILSLAGKLVWAKPRRKDYQSKSYWHAERLLREIGRRLCLSLDQVRSTPSEMLEKWLVLGKKPNLDVIQAVYRKHVCTPYNGRTKVLFGQAAEKFSKTIKSEEKKIEKNIKELRGAIARPGKAQGIVKIINIASDMAKMQEGNILVSTATTPRIVPAMKKAAAILTDEGGLTCHASIVSRELGIPCVVGLKIATKVLRDGDEVKVDANKGIVKKLVEKKN